MRKVIVVAVGVGLWGAGGAGVALAATTATSLRTTVGSSGGSSSAPANATVIAKIAIDPPPSTPLAGGSSGQLPATTQITLRFGAGLTSGLEAFSRCPGATLRTTGPDACPEGSQLGTAAVTFEAYVGGSRLNGITDDARVFRGDGPSGVLLYIHASEPADTTIVMDGKLLSDSDGFATKLVIDTRPASKVQGFDVALRTVAFTLDAKGTGAVGTKVVDDAPPKLPDCKRLRGQRRRACVVRSRNLEFCRARKAKTVRARPRAGADGVTVLRSTGCPTGGFAVQARLAFGDGSEGVADAKAACS